MVLVFELTADGFPIEGKGQALTVRDVEGNSTPLKVGENIELRSTSGEAFQTVVLGITPVYADPFPEDRRFLWGILVPSEVPNSLCKRNVQVWKVENED